MRAAAGWPLAAVWAAGTAALALILAFGFAAPAIWARAAAHERGSLRIPTEARGRVAGAPRPGAHRAGRTVHARRPGAHAVSGAARSAPTPPLPHSPTPAATDTSVTLYLLGTTDVHGHLYPWNYYAGRPGPGLALLAPLIDSVRAAHPGATYLFDSGDLLQGTPLMLLAAHAQGHQRETSPAIRAMNLLGYAASAVGNHEYNYGLSVLDRALAEARFPFVAANVFVAGTDRPAYRPYVLIPHVVSPGDTILVGVTGITPPGVLLWDRAKVRGRLDFRDPVASLEPVVARMKARGADLVVVLNHGGFEGTSYDTLATGLAPENEGARIARDVPGVDVVFLGHTHQQVADSLMNGVLFTQAGAWARSLADAQVTLIRHGPSDWVVADKHATLLRPDPDRPSTILLDSLRADHERAVAYVASIVGRATGAMDASHARTEDTPLVDFVNEVQRRTAGTQLSATAAFSLTARLPAGPVTIGQIAALYPYENTLTAVRITGAQLEQYLEKSAEYYRTWPTTHGQPLVDHEVPGYNFDVVSGVDYVIDLSKPVGRRITSLRYQGRPVRPGQTFTMALNNYRQNGGGGFTMVADAPVVYSGNQNIRDLLIDEVRRRGVIRPADYFHRNWRIVPAAARREAERELAPLSLVRLPATHASPAPKRLRVITTNDLHGHLLSDTYSWSDGRPVGGAAVLAAYFHAERDSFPGPTLLLDAGDEMQGTPISNLTNGRATVAILNALGEGASAIGNHEFDWGVDVLRRRLAQAHYPWLSANIFVAGTDTAPSWVRDTATLDVGGVRVGLIGLTTPETRTATRWQNVAGLDFGGGAAAIDRWVPVLRRRGVDFVIVLAHSGGFCDAGGATNCRGEVVDWARRVREKPDLIIAGHTHTLMRTVVNGIPIVQARSYGTAFAVVDLTRATMPVAVTRSAAVAVASAATTTDAQDAAAPATAASSRSTAVATIRDVPIAWADSVRPDSAIAALVWRYEHEIGPRVDAVVAKVARPLRVGHGDYALGRLVADAWRAETGAQVAFMNNGGVRAELKAGPVTWGQLFELQPFQNRIVVLTLTGASLRRAVEVAVSGRGPDANVSGIRAIYDPSRPAGSRVKMLTLADGTPVRDSATYTVAMPDFLAGGGDHFSVFARPLSTRDTPLLDIDALVNYLRGQPQPVRAPDDARLVPIQPGPGPDGGGR